MILRIASVNHFIDFIYIKKLNIIEIDSDILENALPKKQGLSSIVTQGSPWPKWAGGGAPDKMAPPVVRGVGGAPKTPTYLVLSVSKTS